MARFDYEKLLGGYATGTLTLAERQVLFEAALQDQRLFDALADDEALKVLLDDPVSRQRLISALETGEETQEKQWSWGALVPQIVSATLPSQYEALAKRRSWKGAVGAGLILAALAVIVAAGLIEEMISPPEPVLVADKRPTQEPEPDRLQPTDNAKRPEPPLPSSPAMPPPPPATPPARDQQEEPAMKSTPRPASDSRAVQAARDRVERLTAEAQARFQESAKAMPPPEASTQPKAPAPSDAPDAPPLPNALPLEGVPRLAVARPLSARALFYASTGSVEGERPLGLRYNLIKRTVDGHEHEIDPHILVNPDEELRLSVEVNTTGYLYVLKRTPPETWTILYPNLGNTTDPAGRAAYVHSGTRYSIPSSGSLTVPEDRGPFQFVLILSKRPLPQLGTFGTVGPRQAAAASPALTELVRQIRTQAAGGKLLTESFRETERQAEPAVYLVDHSPVPLPQIFADVMVSVR